ncbi:MAG: hypothetical protein D6732_08640, partial [Methanobacteriota archaeon]
MVKLIQDKKIRNIWSLIFILCVLSGFIFAPAYAAGLNFKHTDKIQKIKHGNGGIVEVTPNHPLYGVFNGKETFQQKELFVRQEFNPLVPENKKVYLNGSFE